MKKIKQINNLTIWRKRVDEVPFGIEVDRRFMVKAPDGRSLEDNLIESESISFCNETTDFIKRIKKRLA